LHYAARLQFTGETSKCTNNIIEYEAILLGLRKLRAIDVQTCVLHTNSKVVSEEIEKECKARELTLEKLVDNPARCGQKSNTYFKRKLNIIDTKKRNILDSF
jgi:ribonuclease HI